MSAHVVVIGTDLRRATVKVSPSTYLTDVLEQACAKFSLPSSKYLLKHKQKNVDLSIPFRTSGLIPGAKLELVLKSNTPSAIQVALQLPLPEANLAQGGRLINKFPSDITLWTLLRQFESGTASQGKNINITARGVAQTADGSGSGGGQLYYETPVLSIMGRELSSFEDFSKTLSGLGYNSGSVLIRLQFKRTDQTLFDAMAEIGQFFKDQEDQRNTDTNNEQTTSASSVEPIQPAATSNHEELPQRPSESSALSEPDIGSSSQAHPPVGQASTETTETESPPPESRFQPVNVFLAPTSEVPQATLAPRNEADYMPTVAHAQLHQARLVESSRNKRLLSDAELAEQSAAEEARLTSVKSLLIKVRFPDNTSSEWRVGADESGSFLYEAVRRVMARPELGFHLVLPGRTVIREGTGPNDNLVRGYKLAGRVLVNLVWNDDVPATERTRPFLLEEVVSQGQAVKVQEIPEGEPEEEAEAAPVQKPKTQRSEGDGTGPKKVPKWFKFGKK